MCIYGFRLNDNPPMLGGHVRGGGDSEDEHVVPSRQHTTVTLLAGEDDKFGEGTPMASPDGE